MTRLSPPATPRPRRSVFFRVTGRYHAGRVAAFAAAVAGATVISAAGEDRPGADRGPAVAYAPPPAGAVPGVPVLPPIQAPLDVNARTLRVGPGGDYATPSAAAAAAKDGDTIEIAPGDYRADVAVWNAHRLRIVGGEPRPRIFADGRDAQGKGIWVVRGDDTTIEHVDLSGAKVPDRNGAAIRVEGRNFTLRRAYLHDNENGLLTGANATSEITIDRCEFARNGGGEGLTHNVYVGNVAKLTVTESWLHHAIGGHNLKSRAMTTVVTDSRLADEGDGRASYEADFSNGGRVTLAFNIFQKAATAENGTLVSYGAEGLAGNTAHALSIKGNTFVSQRPDGARFLFIAPGTDAVAITGNVFAGPGSLPDVPRIRANNAVQKQLPGNVDLKPEGLR